MVAGAGEGEEGRGESDGGKGFMDGQGDWELLGAVVGTGGKEGEGGGVGASEEASSIDPHRYGVVPPAGTSTRDSSFARG